MTSAAAYCTLTTTNCYRERIPSCTVQEDDTGDLPLWCRRMTQEFLLCGAEGQHRMSSYVVQKYNTGYGQAGIPCASIDICSTSVTTLCACSECQAHTHMLQHAIMRSPLYLRRMVERCVNKARTLGRQADS